MHVNIHVGAMVTKTLTITEDAYDILARQKKEGESFSSEIRRLLGRKTRISDLAGSWSDVTEKEAEEMKGVIRRQREESTRHMRDRIR